MTSCGGWIGYRFDRFLFLFLRFLILFSMRLKSVRISFVSEDCLAPGLQSAMPDPVDRIILGNQGFLLFGSCSCECIVQPGKPNQPHWTTWIAGMAFWVRIRLCHVRDKLEFVTSCRYIILSVGSLDYTQGTLSLLKAMRIRISGICDTSIVDTFQ